jgi:DNA polymerase III epsilon subunit-like protein
MILQMFLALFTSRSVHSFQHLRVIRAPSVRFSELNNGQDYVAGLVYDFETTSADPNTNEAVQLAVVCVNSRNEDPPSFVRYILPTGEIDPGAEDVHHISKQLLESEGSLSCSEQ